MTHVKICGIREEAHALAAVEAGADFIGLIFVPGRRQVTPSQAKKIAAAVKQGDKATEVVGVFVNTPAPKVMKIADFCHLDRVQLSGDEPWQYCAKLSTPIIKVVRISKYQPFENICANLAAGERVISNQKHLYLLDPQVKGKYGGTGTTLDWNLAHQVAQRFPVIIAGGLTPQNVAQAIKTAKPWGVDTSSGVETGGVKNIAKIRAFIAAARSADDKYN